MGEVPFFFFFFITGQGFRQDLGFQKLGGSTKSEVDSANASGTQALTLRGLSNPGVLRLCLVYREAVSRYTIITPP